MKIVLVLALAMLFPAVTATAQDLSDADTQEVSSYQLSEPGLAKYEQATRNLAAALAQNPPDCDDEEADSLTAMAAQLDAVPGAQAAISAAGMNTREWVVFGLALFQAGVGSWSLTQGSGNLPPGIAAENVQFYQAHEADIQELSGLRPEDLCGDDEDDGDEDDDMDDPGA